MRGHRNSKRTTLTGMQRSQDNMFQTMALDFHERKLEEMMVCRDLMGRHKYPIEMLQGITAEIDKIITEGMSKRRV